MTFDKQCPGSRTLREPIPEYYRCSNCDTEVEVWADEMSRPCPKCGTRVFQENQGASCLDWCPAAEECVGSELYQRLKLEVKQPPPEPEVSTPLDIIAREYEEIRNQSSSLRGATLCLRMGARATAPESSKVLEQGLINLQKVLEFFDHELRLHFRREEEILFPLLEKYIGKEEIQTQPLREEHAQLWQWYDQLKAKVAEFQKDNGKHPTDITTEIYELGNCIVGLLQRHIDQESESLLAKARSRLGAEALTEIADKWRKLKSEADSA